MQQSNNDTATGIEVIRKYNSVLQTKALLADTTNLVGELGRGSGKTTEMFAPRLVRVSYDMPRSIMLLITPTYTFAIDTLVPGITTYLEKHYARGVQYEIGKEPPKHFKRPYAQIANWKHTISFAWGTVVQFASIDRPESMIGKSVVHIFVDEILRIDETDFIERALPTLREDRELFGKSHYFGGITCFSSTPNFENDHDWWLKWQENVNPEAIEELQYVAYRIMTAHAELIDLQNQLMKCTSDKAISIMNRIKKLQHFINNWTLKINDQRKKEKYSWYYIKGSSFSNLGILGIDYIKRQMQGGVSNFDKFKLSILGIRPSRVKEMFFARFTKKHIFKDSYTYANGYDQNTVAGEYKHTSADLRYCDASKPIILGFDPGNFMSVVAAQERPGECRVIKNFWCITPQSHFEMAAQIEEFFKPHKYKVIKLYYDRAGNQRKKDYENNPKGKTDAAILKRCLEDLGWRVELMNIDQRTIEHWEHYLLLDLLFGEREKKAPKIKICQFECEQLISCIYMSPIKREKGSGIELDKSSEVKLDYEDQVWFSTQLPSALMYMLFGLYEKFKPSKADELPSLGGL